MDELNLPIQIPVDEDYADRHELDIDDAESALSIASSKYNFTIEHGRKYLDYRKPYPFPLDQMSQDNEDFLHNMMLCILNNKHFIAPVSGTNLNNVLDLASGQGRWADHVAEDFPDCHVTGLDIATPADTAAPPNLEFLNVDITQEWVFTPTDIKFDLIHIRNLFATLSEDEWPTLYQQCFDYLQPGAWVEQIEVEIIARCDDNTERPNSTIFRLADLATDMGKAINKDFHIAQRMAGMIRETGFVDVRERSYKLPLGPWSTDPTYRLIGMHYEYFYRTGVQGWLMHALTRGLEYTTDQVNDLCVNAMDEISSRQHHYYFYLRTVIGRKP